VSDRDNIDQDVLKKMFEELVTDNQKKRNKSGQRLSKTPTRELETGNYRSPMTKQQRLRSNKSLISNCSKSPAKGTISKSSRVHQKMFPEFNNKGRN
jgi:hypothetical protein